MDWTVAPDEGRSEALANRLAQLTELEYEGARLLVKATLEASVDRTFELSGGTAPVASSRTAIEAEQLYFICRRLGRQLGQREVEVLFRTTSGRANSIVSTMQATYDEALQTQYDQRIAQDKLCAETGTEEHLTYTLDFSDLTTFRLALNAISRKGFRSSVVSETQSTRRIVISRSVTVGDGQRNLLDVLGWGTCGGGG
jgi:hypothetical protein